MGLVGVFPPQHSTDIRTASNGISRFITRSIGADHRGFAGGMLVVLPSSRFFASPLSDETSAPLRGRGARLVSPWVSSCA